MSATELVFIRYGLAEYPPNSTYYASVFVTPDDIISKICAAVAKFQTAIAEEKLTGSCWGLSMETYAWFINAGVTLRMEYVPENPSPEYIARAKSESCSATIAGRPFVIDNTVPIGTLRFYINA